jgi:hypothetical protein
MTTLVVHYNALSAYPFDRWLAEDDGGVVLLGARDKIELAGEKVPNGSDGYRHLEVLDTFDDEKQVRERALVLAQRFGVTRVVGLHESDVDRAAEVRDLLGLAGMSRADVQPFRDKLLMKRRLSEAGLEVAPHALGRDLADFPARWGFPLVVKERSGFGSVNLRVVRAESELDVGPDLLVEAFVPGRMSHVDGLVVDGRTVLSWPSQYQYDLFTYATDPKPRIDLTMEKDDPLTARLLDATERALRALSNGPRTHAFHAEFFHTPDDRLVVCEVAARPGGARIKEIFGAMFGMNLAEYAARAEVGLPLPGLDGRAELPVPERMIGQMVLMKRPGTVVRLPEPPGDDWIVDFGVAAEVGQVLTAPNASADFLIAVVGQAPTREICEQRLRKLSARFEAETVIEPGTDRERAY